MRDALIQLVQASFTGDGFILTVASYNNVTHMTFGNKRYVDITIFCTTIHYSYDRNRITEAVDKFLELLAK